MTECRLMAHMIAGYPDMERSREIARALVDGGADYLEVQFPFSDPSSDGPLIERAGQRALDAGFTVDGGFALMRRLSRDFGLPLFIMTYGSLVYARGAREFARTAADAGVAGLIVPDLPPDYSEGLFAAGKEFGVAVAPVVAPEISAGRLDMIAAVEPEYIYTALRLGITGRPTTLDENAIAHLERIGGIGAKVVAGFGVRAREQMIALSGRVHAAAVGSFFLERMDAATDSDPTRAVREAARGLKGR